MKKKLGYLLEDFNLIVVETKQLVPLSALGSPMTMGSDFNNMSTLPYTELVLVYFANILFAGKKDVMTVSMIVDI